MASNAESSNVVPRNKSSIIARVFPVVCGCLVLFVLNDFRGVDRTQPSTTISLSYRRRNGGAIVKDGRPNEDDAIRARAFVADRRQAYHDAGLDYRWKLRGIGYLFHTHHLILQAMLPHTMQSGNSTWTIPPRDKKEQMKPAITIWNVNNDTTVPPFTECDKLSIWVRVSGPEIFAGLATAVPQSNVSKTSCRWEYAFDLRVPGAYEVDVKVLIWNGDAPIGGTSTAQCDVVLGLPDNKTLATLKHDGFQGFKMYHPAQMCCEVCARTPNCTSWATPFLRLIDKNVSRGRNGCELMFAADAPDDVVPVSSLWPPPPAKQRRLLDVETFTGPVHNNPASYFCGCGWSFWFTLDFPCLSGDLDDRIYMTESTFTATTVSNEPTTTTTRSIADESEQLPICSLNDEHVGVVSSRSGRWVRRPWPNATSCPYSYEQADLKSKSFPMTKFDDLYPECWHREDMTLIGRQCLEMNCWMINGTTSQWNSSIHQDKQFVAVWRPYDCYYVQFTKPQLQQCITTKTIVQVTTSGASVAAFLQEFIDHRLENVTMYPNTAHPNATTVIVDTLSLLHKNGPDGMLEDFIAELPVVPDNTEHYWVSGFFLSSEREVHCHVSRMANYNRILAASLGAKNYKMINAFDTTAAFTYDAATQMDGMHIVGPPTKMAITKFFHHLCKDVVDGSPV